MTKHRRLMVAIVPSRRVDARWLYHRLVWRLQVGRLVLMVVPA